MASLALGLPASAVAQDPVAPAVSPAAVDATQPPPPAPSGKTIGAGDDVAAAQIQVPLRPKRGTLPKLLAARTPVPGAGPASSISSPRGASAQQVLTGQRAPAQRQLAFTGFPAWQLVLAGLVLVAAGGWTLRSSRPRMERAS